MYTKQLKQRENQEFQHARELKIKNKGLMRKKNFVLIAVIATTLASCSNDLLLDNQDSSQATIGFTSFSEKSTRGTNTSTDLEYFHNTFAVYGTKQSNDDETIIQYLFGGNATEEAGVKDGVTCTYQGDDATGHDPLMGEWKYDFPRFWDKSSDYDFIAYAPVSDKNPIRYKYNAVKAQVGDDGNDFVLKSGSSFILTGTNLQATSPGTAEINKGFTGADGTDIDLMTSSDLVKATDRSVAVKGNERIAGTPVQLVFKHILSKLNVRVNKAESLYGYTVTVKSIEITGFEDKGTAYSEKIYSNDATTPRSGWTAGVQSATYKLAYNAGLIASSFKPLNEGNYTDNAPSYTAGAPIYFIESLLIPQTIVDNQVSLKIRYRIERGAYVDDRADVIDLYDIENLRTLLDRYNYTLNITINPEIIKFDATVATWSWYDGGTHDTEVQ